MLLAGSVRDRDIALRLLKESAPSASSPLVHQFRTEREEAARTLVGLLKRWVRRNSSAKWRNALEGESAAEVSRANPVETTAKQVVPRMAREYFERGRDASRDESPVELLHRLRIAAKNLRYTLDLFAPFYGASVAGLQQQLKGVQALLGEINDCATVRRMVSHHEGGQQILPALKRRQRKKAEQFRQHWAAAFSSAAAVRRWTDNLRYVSSQTHMTRKPPARSRPAVLVAGQSASA